MSRPSLTLCAREARGLRGDIMGDTIAAIATGMAVTAIGIVRVSGPGAVEAAERVFRPADGSSLGSHPPRKLVYGELRGPDGAVIDLCLATISRAPHSYTGEDTAELQCHGSPAVLRAALDALFAAGARQALPGEFTRRAFLNGRLDLVQAEAVIDIIEAETAEGARNAVGQLGGAMSRRVDGIYSALLDIEAHFGAVLDYPDEDIEPFELGRCREVLSGALEELNALLGTFERGRIMREGVPVALVGRPNAGKSSLLNALLGYERAIVTSSPGTTRDTIEEKVLLGGVLVRLTDTAGLRSAEGEAERLGVRRALAAAEGAELVLAVFDGSEPLTAADGETLAVAERARRVIAVINKADLPGRLDKSDLPDVFDAVLDLSARTLEGLDALAAVVAGLFPAPSAPAGEILTNARQASAVSRAAGAVRAALEALDSGLTPDAVLTEAEEALSALGELTGRTVRDDVVDRIFERFCVGK